jgi:predicted ester cyclase
VKLSRISSTKKKKHTHKTTTNMSDSNVKAFFEACETGKGWAECKQYCADDAAFACDALPDIASLEKYTEWMLGLATATMPGCKYDLHNWAVDGDTTTIAYATFHGTHSGEGGPVPATGKSMSSRYVYVISHNANGKVTGMIKVWNSGPAFAALGWA